MSVSANAPRLLFLHPWIYDFSAYDFWLKPLGLLTLAGLFRAHGFQTAAIDALQPPPAFAGRRPQRRAFGTGKFLRTEVVKPKALKDVPRIYARYGVPPEALSAALSAEPIPQAIFVSGIMSYWYPGVRDAIRLLKEVFPLIPVILGGVYATLCPEHARRESGADFIVSGSDPAPLKTILRDHVGIAQDLSFLTLTELHRSAPAWDLLPEVSAVCLQTSYGCPWRCPYCASFLLQPHYQPRDPALVLGEIEYWSARGVRDFAFYDDALLYRADEHLIPVLEGLTARGLTLRFHCPNGLHIKYLDLPLAKLLKRSGFTTLRFGLETADPARQKALGGKTDSSDFIRAANVLRVAGFSREEVGCYLLAGLPGQPWREVEAGIRMVKSEGLRPFIAEFSPIPGTPFWEEAKAASPFDLENEPLWHNNTLLPCRSSDFTPNDLVRLKNMLRET